MVEHLTKKIFQDKVFDYENEKEWKYRGNIPCVIDFYADWCGPCKMVAPILEDLAHDYDEKIKIYKVNTDQEQELAAVFGINSIPSILFVPKEGKPQMAVGALSRKDFEVAFESIINNIKE